METTKTTCPKCQKHTRQAEAFTRWAEEATRKAQECKHEEEGT